MNRRTHHHLIVGYDRETDAPEMRLVIPDAVFARVAAFLPESPMDPGFRHSYPLTRQTADAMLKSVLEQGRARMDLDYYIESREGEPLAAQDATLQRSSRAHEVT